MPLKGSACVALALLALALAGCGKKEPPAAAPHAAAGAAAVAPWAGTVMTGSSTEALRTYLRSVQSIEPRKLDVKWTAATVQIDREAALRSLLAVSRDGAAYTFDSSEPALARLRAGSVLFVWGVALRKVTAIDQGERATIVRTVPAALQEAIANGEIEFEYRAPLRNFVVVPRALLPAVPARTTQLRPGFMLANYRSVQAPAADGQEPPEPRATGNHTFEGEFKGFQYSLAFVPGDGGLAFDLQLRKGDDDVAAGKSKDAEDKRTEKQTEDMRKADEDRRKEVQKGLREMRPESKDDPQKEAYKAAREYAEDRKNPFRAPAKEAARQLFEMASDMLDLRIKADGVLQGVDGSDKLVVFGRMVFQDGAVALLQSNFKNVSGTVNVQYIVRRGELSEQWIEKLRLDLPLTVNVPIVVGGLPLMLQVGFDLLVTPALATKNDAFRGAFAFKFNGSGGTQFVKGAPSAEAQMTGEGEARAAQAASIGVSAVLVALQAPRIGLGIGLFGASTIGYIDMVTATSVTSAGTLGMFPCKKWDSYWTMNAGIDAKVAMFEKDFRTDPPLLKKEWHKIEPQIKACELKEGK